MRSALMTTVRFQPGLIETLYLQHLFPFFFSYTVFSFKIRHTDLKYFIVSLLHCVE